MLNWEHTVCNLHNVKDAKLDKFNAGAYADAIAQAAKAVDAEL
jgi:electron transfer flavoprotein alpha subunit